MDSRVLIDTSAWIEALREDGDPEMRETVRSATAAGKAVLCDLVRLELWNGAQGATEQRLLRDLERELECVPTSERVWEAACDLARACRRRGLTLPATDLLIAACAEQHGLALLHTDSHFDQLSGGRIDPGEGGPG